MCIPSRIGGCDAALCFSINTIGLQVGCVCQRTTMGPTAVTYMFSGKHAYIPIYIYMHMHICMYVYIFIHAYIIVYVYIYDYTDWGDLWLYKPHLLVLISSNPMH